MPIACDPNQTTTFCLKNDDATPEDQRPVFRSRYMTARERDRVRDLIDNAAPLEDERERRAKYLEALAIGLKGWERLKGPGGADVPSGEIEALPDALTGNEILNLAIRMYVMTDLSETVAKKSEQPSPLDAEKSASDALATAAAGSV